MSEAHPHNVNGRLVDHLDTLNEAIDATGDCLWSQSSMQDRLSRGQTKW